MTYGLETGLVPQEEQIYTTNLILDCLKLDDYEDDGVEYKNVELEPVLNEILDYAVSKGIIEDIIV